MGDNGEALYSVSFVSGLLFWFAAYTFGTMFIWNIFTSIIEDAFAEVYNKKQTEDDIFGLFPQTDQ
jgi:hypothetical protein